MVIYREDEFIKMTKGQKILLFKIIQSVSGREEKLWELVLGLYRTSDECFFKVKIEVSYYGKV